MNVYEFMNHEGNTSAIVNAIAKAWDVLGRHQKPVVTVSGGSDSDIVVDMISKLDEEHKVSYGWYNTGLEMEAAKKQLRYLEGRYGITIETLPLVKPIARTVRENGQPFLSKYVSYAISSLQRHGYDFRADSTFEQDVQDFPGCKDGLNWWHSTHHKKSWNISNYRYLRQFLSMYPPTFPISDRCCHYSKKLPSERLQRSGVYDLVIMGLRLAEGGVRAALKSCYLYSDRLGYRFMPILYLSNEDKRIYNRLYNIENGEAYTVYHFARTGCTGCPFNPRLFQDMEVLSRYEPGLAKAASKIFAPSYEYTRKYMKFCEGQYVLSGKYDELYRLFRR